MLLMLWDLLAWTVLALTAFGGLFVTFLALAGSAAEADRMAERGFEQAVQETADQGLDDIERYANDPR